MSDKRKWVRLGPYQGDEHVGISYVCEALPGVVIQKLYKPAERSLRIVSDGYCVDKPSHKSPAFFYMDEPGGSLAAAKRWAEFPGSWMEWISRR